MQNGSVTLVSILLVIATSAASAQMRTAEPQDARTAAAAPVPRDEWQRPNDILAALGAKPGSRIADLGAGQGWLTLRLARHVAAAGRVFAVDIDPNALATLSDAATKESLTNVEIVLGEADDPRLPYGTLDGVVILNAYHEMPQRVAILESVKRALKPSGVLVIVDNAPADSTLPRKEQMSHHGLQLELARDDLEAQGFEIVKTDATFIERSMGDHVMRQWLLIARRGAK
jgi:predicted methyltransferase